MDRAVADRNRLLLRFGRLAAESSSPEELLAALAEAGVDQVGIGAAAAAVLRVGEDGRVHLAHGRGLPDRLCTWSEDLDTMGPELGRALWQAWNEPDRQVRTLALVSDRAIYGALVLFSGRGAALADEQVSLSEGLADLVAVALDRAAKDATLARSFAELRASREALAKTEKLRALGEMAAGISHDIKNILNPLALQLELLRRRVQRKADNALEVIGNMEEALRAGVEVVERLRAFSRQSPEREAEPVDLDRVLETAAELCRPRVPLEKISLVTVPGGAPPVLARKAELVTAVVNLVFNALDALAGADRGGTVCLRTGGGEGNGFIQVEDDGPGMPPEVEKRIFEPFFTTKEHGTGLGLAMVYAFVKRHGGNITLRTGPGQGTTFRLTFPTSGAAASTGAR